MDGHRGLVVVGGGEHLRGLGRDRGVLLDQLGHHAAQGFDAQRQRGDVEQQHVLDFALQHAALDGGADGDGFVGVHVTARILAEELLHLLDDLRHAGLAADQDHVVDVGTLTPASFRATRGLDGALDQVFDQRLELGAGDLQRQVLRAGGVGGDVGQVDFGLLAGGQLDLGLFGGFLQALGPARRSSDRRLVPF